MDHEIDFVDLLEVKMPLLEQAHHWHAPGTAPKWLEDLASRVSAADCYLFISPEYNHSMSPALVNFLNHFELKNYTYKPSAIAVYSMGPSGGVRAAMQLRAYTSEMGFASVQQFSQHLPLWLRWMRKVIQSLQMGHYWRTKLKIFLNNLSG